MESQNAQVQQQPTEHKKKTHEKGEKKEKKQFKSEYVFDAEAITVDTEIPPLPKKTDLLKKPQLESVKQKEKKNRQKIQKLIEQIKQIRAENYKPQKTAKKGEQESKHDVFRNEIEQVKELRQRFLQVKKQRNEKRDLIGKLIEEAKQNNALIKDLGGKSKTSKETLSEKLYELEQKLMTAVLVKDEEKNLNNEITLLKRKIKDSESVGNIESKIEKAQERKEELDHQIETLKKQKQPLEKEYDQIKALLDKKNAAIDVLKKDLDSDKKEQLEQKEKNSSEWEKWKDAKKKRIDAIDEKIKGLKTENDQIWEDFNKQKEEYWKQKHYVDWIEWQMKVKARKVNEIEREKKRQEYEKRDKEYEKQQKLQKYIGQIELCNILIQYLKTIKEDWARANQANQNEKKEAVDVGAKLTTDSQWKNQKVEVIQSKKSQVEEEAPKKGGKKNKNRNQEKKEDVKVFNIPYNIQNQFESLKVLAPSSIEEVDKKIEELKEREKLFERGCQEEQVSESDSKLLDEIKNKKSSGKQVEKKKIEIEEFPTI